MQKEQDLIITDSSASTEDDYISCSHTNNWHHDNGNSQSFVELILILRLPGSLKSPLKSQPASAEEIEAFTTRMDWKLVGCKILLAFSSVNILRQNISHSLFHLLCRGSSNAKVKCPWAISDIAMMFNQAQEGLYGPSKADCSVLDLFTTLPGVRELWVKFCKQQEKRLHTLIPHRSIIPTKEDDSTSVSIHGFVKEWKTTIKTLKAQKLVPVT